MNNSSAKPIKPPISKADKKRAANYDSKIEEPNDLNADLNESVDYTKSKSPINSKYQLAKLRAQKAGGGRSQSNSRLAGLQQVEKLRKQSKEIKQLLASEQIEAGDKVLDKLGALKKSQEASRAQLGGLNKSEIQGARDLSEQPTGSR